MSARPGPTQPTLIPPLPAGPIVFADVDALARHLHRQRGRRGLRLARCKVSYAGSDTFTAFAVTWTAAAGGAALEEYACTLAGLGDDPARLDAALAAANPAPPR